MPFATLSRSRRIGLLCLLVTAVGWGLNWPVMKLLLREWPPLAARGTAGIAAALGLAVLAVLRSERLAVPPRAVPPLLLAAALNVTAWMGLATVSLLWLTAGEGALLVYTMPIWATLLAWPILGERPTAGRLGALALGVAGVVVLLAGTAGHGPGPEAGRLPGVALALGSAVLFALGTVLLRRPLRPPPLAPPAPAPRPPAARHDGLAGRPRLRPAARGQPPGRTAGPARPDGDRLGGDGLHDRGTDGRVLPLLVRRPAPPPAGHGLDCNPARAAGRRPRGGALPRRAVRAPA